MEMVYEFTAAPVVKPVGWFAGVGGVAAVITTEDP